MRKIAEKAMSWVRKSDSLVDLILMLPVGQQRSDRLLDNISEYLKRGESALDVGCGAGNITKRLQERGHKVTGLDITNISIHPEIEPVIYDGGKFPFKNNSFDVAIIITVLHHVDDPEKMLKEARRVAKRIIIVEDIYESSWQKYLTYVMDSVVNFEYFGHPHTNKSDEGWKKTFKKLRLKLLGSKYESFWRFFRSGIYHLEK